MCHKKSLSIWTKEEITFLNFTILDGEKYFKMNFLVIYSQVLIEFGANKLSQSMTAPFEEKLNDLSFIAFSDTW